MAWRWQRSGRAAHALGAWLGWGLDGLLAALATLANPWQRWRLLEGLWPTGEPDLYAKHHAWSQLMEALTALSPMGGGSGSVVPLVWTRVDDAAWLLRVGTGFGWLAMGWLASAVVLFWLLLTAWLATSPVGARLGLRWRRMGVALGWLHALAAALYGAWSLGYSFIPVGALAPLAHAGWGVLTCTLAVVVWRAWQQRRWMRLGAGAGPVRRKRAGVFGVSGWRSGWALLCGGSLALSVVGIGYFPVHVKGWQNEQSERANRYRPAPRLALADRTGEQLLAQNVLAYDLWVRPAELR